VDVRQNTTLRDGHMTKKLVQLFVVSDGELEVTRNDTRLLVVTSGIACQLENFGSQVLQDCSEVNRGASTDTLGIVALPQQTMNTTDREGETSLGRATGKTELAEPGARTGDITYDCAFLEPLALPPDFPPPVIFAVIVY